MKELKEVSLSIKLNDFVSPVVATFKVPLDMPIDDSMVGQVMVHLAEMVVAHYVEVDE